MLKSIEFAILCLLIMSAASSSKTLLHLHEYNQSFEGPPEIFLIGSQKAGTSSMSDLLVSKLKICIESNHNKVPTSLSELLLSTLSKIITEHHIVTYTCTRYHMYLQYLPSYSDVS
jgi:hypothetical protein